MSAWVFGYASLVALEDDAGAVPGRLCGYRRLWGVAMDNWEGGEGAKHWLDRETGERPRIRVAYLDIEPSEGRTVNGVAIPVDAERMTQLDAREINYRRIDVTAAFEGDAGGQVFTYVGLPVARERCRWGVLEGNAFVAAGYVATVRQAFERVAGSALTEFERTTDPLPFPELDLQVVLPGEVAGFSPR